MNREPLTLETALAELHRLAVPERRDGMARYGINTSQALGVSIYELRPLAKGQQNHQLALQLWETGIHEARLLASFIDNPAEVTREQMDAWVLDFDSWDLCDQACSNLFDRTAYTLEYIYQWAAREEEFVRRAAFAMIASIAWHQKDQPDEFFYQFFPLITQYSTDSRNFVKKAVNWALRNIGKRNPALREEALRVAREIKQIDSPAARWIASDAIRELEKKAALAQSQ